MRILMALPDEKKRLTLRDALENRDENTTCTLVDSGPAALKHLDSQAYDALIIDSVLKEIDGAAVLESMLLNPIWYCPYVLFIGETRHSDASLSRSADTASFILAIDGLKNNAAPYFYRATKAVREAAAGALLQKMNMPLRLKGAVYLKTMIPLALANPKYRERYRFTLYPLAAEYFHVSAASVERCVRHAIETTFSHGELAAIEGLFGQSYDPERGKPTNREFIAMCVIHLKEEYTLCTYGKK